MQRTNFESREQRHEVGRYLAQLLRELAPSLDLNPDKFGSIELTTALHVMAKEFPFVQMQHLTEIVEKDAQHRFAIEKGRIRAKAGHKVDISIPSAPVRPPEKLYHGTTADSASAILKGGLRKMGKAYVHSASTVARARRVGIRKSSTPVIVEILARRASENGIRFWRSGQISPDGEIYLSDEIPGEFIIPVSQS